MFSQNLFFAYHLASKCIKSTMCIFGLSNASFPSSYYCYYNLLYFYRASGNGTWSTDGIERVSIKYETTMKGIQYNLICNSSHITPFVVLVDLHGVEVDIALCNMSKYMILLYL